MRWDPSIILLAPDDFLVEGLAELLRKAGYAEVGREYKKKGDARLITVIGERENPFQGPERLAVSLLRGKARSEWLKSVLKKYGRAILIVLGGDWPGLEQEGVKVLGPEWLAEAFNRYSIEPPRTLLEKLIGEEESREGVEFREFVLDGPLVEPLDTKNLVEEARKVAAYKYGVSPEASKVKALRLKLRPVYIVSWSRESDSGKALVDGDRVVMKAEGELKGLAMKVLLEDVATVQATEVEIKEAPGPERFVIEEAVRKEWLDLKVVQTRKAYVPEGAELVFEAGRNEIRVHFDFNEGRVWAEAEPLPDEVLLELAGKAVFDATGEEPNVIEATKRSRFTVLRGKTRRYLFEVEINSYSGEVKRVSPVLSEEAVLEILLGKYPDGRIIGIERKPERIVVDLIAEGSVKVLSLEPRTGEVLEERSLSSPVEVLRKALGSVPALDSLELKSCRVTNHQIVRAEFEGRGIKASITYDGSSGEIIEKNVTIERDLAVELALERYPGFKAVFVEESGEGFSITLENERQVVRLLVSREGNLEEMDRFVKGSVVEEIALERIADVEPNPSVEGLRLSDHWEVEFTGSKTFGKLVIHRKTGEVLSFEYQYIESAIAKAFERFVGENYGDSVSIEWVAHNIEEGYASIKGVGGKGTYFAKFNTLTGELLEHDFVPAGGLTSKLRLAQVEGKYTVK
ncbi:hypothetical protein [Thermococcus sp. MV11]|uniref:hypothetical protein n=1 Tax=Thermococcus sp. MV11 TaxID=1638267 RepID=UPI0014306485|nr:hypothetical protein [Thermococcus sp. MV11]NJE02784.1 hypothetical protein [Thermococcus sp. MV11]